jgi:hypothetical protein
MTLPAVVLVTTVASASGSRAAAAALASAASEPDRAALLVDLSGARAPRPSLIATAAARRLEERLAAHLPEAGVASRGPICWLRLAPEVGGLERVGAALPLVRDSAAVLHLEPGLLHAALDLVGVRPTALLLRADLATDRPLTALAVREQLDRGLRVAVLKCPLGWLTARRALLGAPPGDGTFPPRLRGRLLECEQS